LRTCGLRKNSTLKILGNFSINILVSFYIGAILPSIPDVGNAGWKTEQQHFSPSKRTPVFDFAKLAMELNAFITW
jgi:hypothetical protein